MSLVGDSVEWIESGRKEVVDSGFERCRMRLPLERRSSDRKRKWLSRKKKFFEKQLDRNKGCCRMRGLG